MKTTLQFDTNMLQAASTDGAPLLLLDGTNVDTYVRAFADTDDDTVWGKFRVPSNINANGTVTFSVACVAETASSDNVKHRIGHLALAPGESWDQAYSTVTSADSAMDATADEICIHTFTETVANLDWVADDLVLFYYTKIAASADDLDDDMYLFHITIELPV